MTLRFIVGRKGEATLTRSRRVSLLSLPPGSTGATGGACGRPYFNYR